MTTVNELLVGQTHSWTIKFVREGDGGGPEQVGLEQVVLGVEPQGWDVTDPARREAVARARLGDDYDWHVEHRSAQWWIDPNRNAAALAIYRPRVE